MDFLNDQEKLDEMIRKCHTSFRLSFAKEIMNFKLKTHECQLNCYRKFHNENDLYKAELCAKDCALPLLGANVSITKLISKIDKDHNECRNLIESKDSNVSISAYSKCFHQFRNNLVAQREEIKFIYDGFYKQF